MEEIYKNALNKKKVIKIKVDENDDFIYEDCPIRKYYDDNGRYNLIKIYD